MYCICSSCCLRGCLWEMYSFLLPPLSRRLFRLTFINKLHILLYIFLSEQRYKIMWWAHFINLVTLFFFFPFLCTKIFAAEVTAMSQLQHNLIAKSNQRPREFSPQPSFQETFLGKAVSGCSPSPRSVDSRTVVETQHGPLFPTKPINLPQSGESCILQFCVLHFFPHGLSH